MDDLPIPSITRALYRFAFALMQKLMIDIKKNHQEYETALLIFCLYKSAKWVESV